ncbi:HAMP domain-containing sensor histidine kinase [Draconibacterium orientale]|uniref:sensor histidine kinase n=1 Tax=Draconibacterium orientale TaxID=1168034 RepID=UPI002ABE5D1F|nr:HAMP domain-containing sensor histidine kinase [Draconibacterium orientale]
MPVAFKRKIKFEYRITFLYLLIGGLWIIFSDRFLLTLTQDQKLLTQFQTYKGWFYVVATSVLLFLLLKSHLKKLRKAEAEAKKSNDLKTAFLQNISHEIRTPMNSIVGFSDILNTQKFNEEEVNQYLAIIRNSSNQLLYIVNQLLDISMIESGNVKVFRNTFILNKMIDEINAAFSPLVKDSIKFVAEKGLSDNESYIVTDAGKLRQIIMNLLNNANKYTAAGSIKLGYTLENNMLRFTIEDSGIGIAFDQQQYIFQRFQKAHNEHKEFYDGVGLGLSICKGNIDLLKGDIGFTSTKGEGSTFYFRIPYTPASR